MKTSLTAEQIQAVVSTIYAARTDKQVKLRYGLRHRTQLVEALRQDKIDRSDYRYRWLMETRNEIILTLRKSAETFNEKNPHDCISVQDFIDTVEAVLLVLKSNS